MESKFYLMFATPPLFVTQYEGTVDSFLSEAYSIPYRDSFGNKVSTDTYILKRPGFNKLENFFLEHINSYTRQVLGSEEEIGIQQSWVNITQGKQNHPKHYHSNSYLSGVFYLNTVKDTPIVFDSPHTHNWPIRPEPKEYLTVGGNEFTNDSYSYMASAGDLVIFPSSIPHWVPVNTTDENRVSISFNTFPKIPFGGLDNTTRLT